jgi:hypothetical protein
LYAAAAGCTGHSVRENLLVKVDIVNKWLGERRRKKKSQVKPLKGRSVAE